MRKSVKVVCASVLCAVMAFTGTVPFKNITTKPKTTISADGEYDGEFTYQKRRYQYKNNGSSEITLVRILDPGGELSVPSSVTIDGKKKTVTKLDYPFCCWQKYSKIFVPSTVKTLGNYVFYNTTADKISLPSNIESIGDFFAARGIINDLTCSSKKIKSIGGYAFWETTGQNVVIVGNWLVKYKLEDSEKVCDVSTSKFSGITNIVDGAFDLGDDKDITFKIAKNDKMFLNKYFKNLCNKNIAEVYLNGKPVKCTSANDTVPDIMKKNYDFFDWSKFNITYSKDKAKYVLQSMGLTYYGPNNSKKGKLSANDEYNICKKVHDYVVKNYTYDTSANGSFGKVFNCHTVSKCAFDARMFAFIAECAGVEVDTVDGQELIPITAKEKEQLLKTDPSIVCPVGNYKFGKWGNHCWNVATIGGNKYYVDTTNDRTNHMYCLFLFSDETTEKGTWLWGGGHIDPNPMYTHYAEDKWNLQTNLFQNRKLSYTIPKCTVIHGDLNGDYYCTETDREMLSAFLCVGNTIRDKCLKSTNGYVSLTDKEFETINDSVNSDGKKTTLAKKEANGKIKLLSNPKATDINFDGKVSIADVVVMNQRLGDPLSR